MVSPLNPAPHDLIKQVNEFVDYNYKKIDVPADRVVLFRALKTLEFFGRPDPLLTEITQYRRDYEAKIPHKSSLLQKIEKGWQNVFSGRVSSKKLQEQARLTGGALLVNEAERLLEEARDPKKGNEAAIDCLVAAHKLGNPRASFLLAKLLDQNLTEKERAKITVLADSVRFGAKRLKVDLLKIAAKAGKKEAFRELGIYYEQLTLFEPTHEPGTKYHFDKVEKEAATWFLKGAKKGDIECQFRYGLLMAQKNYQTQVQQGGSLRMAADAGHPLALFYCGMKALATDAKGLEIFKAITPGALKDLKNAAQGGVADASFVLGIIDLENGHFETALSNLTKAARLGCVEAEIVLAAQVDRSNKLWLYALKDQQPITFNPERFDNSPLGTVLSSYIRQQVLGAMLEKLNLSDDLTKGG